MELLEFCNWYTFSGGTMALESTRFLTEMSKRCRCVGLTTLLPSWSPWSSWSQSIGRYPRLALEPVLSGSWNNDFNDDSNTVKIYLNFVKPLKCHIRNTDSCFFYITSACLLLLTHGGHKTKAFALSGWRPKRLRKSGLMRSVVPAEHLQSITARNFHSRNMIASVYKPSQA